VRSGRLFSRSGRLFLLTLVTFSYFFLLAVTFVSYFLLLKGGAGFGNWVLQGVFKARCGFLGFGVGGCGFLGWRAWVLSVGGVGGGVSVGFFSFF
jgi:hypothetical protein